MDNRLASMGAAFAIILTAMIACSQSGDQAGETRLQGPRTVVYSVPDLARAKDWYTEALGVKPYFDEAYYVGFNVGGYELGLNPKGTVAQPVGSGVRVFWGVDNIDEELDRLLGIGAKPHKPVEDIGADIKVASVLDPYGNLIGLIYNPHFAIID
ncbi:MAG: VOC family protein [Acidiferrobacterales bacterium]